MAALFLGDEGKKNRRIILCIFAAYVVFNHSIRAISGHSGVPGAPSINEWSGTAPSMVLNNLDNFRFKSGQFMQSQASHCPKSISDACHKTFSGIRMMLGLS